MPNHTHAQTNVKELEQAVLKWLRAALEDPEIGATDNFLDVGGHSLLFAQLNKILADSFEVVLDQRLTYSAPLGVAAASARPSRSDRQTSDGTPNDY